MKRELLNAWRNAIFSIGLSKFPVIQTIRYKKKNIGTITVNFKLPKKSTYYRKKSALKEKEIIGEFLVHCAREMYPFFYRMEFELELFFREKKVIDKTYWQKSSAATFTDWLLRGYLETLLSTLSESLFCDDEFLFELLRTEGPRLLANSGVIKKIEEWIEEKKHVNLNKMKNSLCLYLNPKDLPFKVGRPSKSMMKGNLSIAYKYLLTRLRKMNECKNWNEIIREDNKFLKKLEKVNFIPNKLVNKWLETRSNIFRLIEFIDADENLKKEFYEYQWIPHEMAKKILSRFIGVSEEKLIDILWRKRK